MTDDVCFTDGGGGGGTGWVPPPGGGGGGSGSPSGSGGAPPPCNPNPPSPVAYRCGPGWNPKPPQDPDNPCIGAKGHAKKAALLTTEPVFQNAVTQIQGASQNVEHAIGFGRNAQGNLIASPMSTGGSNHGTVPPVEGGFADIHNHPNNYEPSAGDLYSLINKNTPANGYDTRFVMTGGTLYAFVIYDPVKADNFATRFPADQNGSNAPEYPSNANGNLFDDYDKARLYFKDHLGYSKLEADAMGQAFVFEKYGAGVAILKQQTDGSFKILRAKQTSNQPPLGTYEVVSCN